MKKNYEVLQDGFKECGTACLLSIIRYYGGNISMEKLLELTNTTKEGTTFYDLKQAALEIGLTAKAYNTKDINKLYEIDMPFISQVIINNYKHFIVIYKMNNSKITIMDPAKGMHSITKDELISIWTGNIMIFEPYKVLPIYKEESYLVNTIKVLLINNQKLVINTLGLTFITTIFTCIYSYHFKVLIDNISITNTKNIVIISIIFGLIILIKLLTTFLRNNLLLYLNQKLDLSIITSTINKILSLPLSYYRNKTTGNIIARINDLMTIKNIISKIITNILFDSILAIIAIIILFSIDKEMTLLLLIIAIIYLLVFLIFKNLFKNLTISHQEKSALLNSFLVEAISSYETIKGLNLESTFKKKINNYYLDVTNNNLLLSKYINISEFIKNIFENIIIIIVIYLGIIKVMDKSLSIGTLVTYNTILYYFITPIRESLNFYRELFYIGSSIKRINSLLDYKEEDLSKPKKLNMMGGIYFKNLNYSYNNRDLILKDITLLLPPATRLMILGKSGSGKSTLLKILYKHYEIPRDKVFISGYDINDFNLSDIRENIAYISQNEYLYSDTIRNNILLDRNIKEEEFLKVCQITHVTDIVKNKSLSYNFRLEENGTNISGGERKRIILARALLKPSSIILIDEGLNELDINLERDILENIFSLYPYKLFIVISHRPNNMDLFTKVIKIDNGSLVKGLNKYV